MVNLAPSDSFLTEEWFSFRLRFRFACRNVNKFWPCPLPVHFQSKTISKGLTYYYKCKYVSKSIPNYHACQRHGIIPIGINVIILYLMHYTININKSNIASQLPLIMTSLKTWKETNNFLGIMHPLNCSLHCRRTLYMKNNNVTACIKYFYSCNIEQDLKNCHGFCTMKISIS